MLYNAVMLSVLRGIHEEQLEQRNPVAKMAKLLNRWHSIHRIYATDEQKDEIRLLIKNELKKLKPVVPANISAKIDLWLDDASNWENDRDGIHI